MSRLTLVWSVGGLLVTGVVGLVSLGAAAETPDISPAFLAGAAAVLGALALVLRVLPGVFRSGESGVAMRTLTLVEKQHEDWKEALRQDREQTQATVKLLQQVAASLERSTGSLTAIALTVEQTHRDLEDHVEQTHRGMDAHEVDMKQTREQIAEMHAKLMKKGR